MRITSKTEAIVSRVKILPGTRNYKLDHKDPSVAWQLRILRDNMKSITFDEILEGDYAGTPEPVAESAGEAVKDDTADIRARRISGKGKDAGSKGGEVAE